MKRFNLLFVGLITLFPASSLWSCGGFDGHGGRHNDGFELSLWQMAGNRS